MSTVTRAVAVVVVLLAGSARAQSPAVAPVGPTSTAAMTRQAAPRLPLGVERRVPVATRALPRGATLSPGDYEVAAAIIRPALRTAAAAESGWVTRRPVAAGEPLIEPAVGPPAFVTSGQPVTFLVEHGSIRLALRGTAASAGALGDRVWVRLEAGRRLRGVVTAPGTVRADTTSIR